MSKQAALILAAGKGTRMHSDKPKVLQTLLGEPMLAYVLHAVRPLFEQNVWTVVGHKAQQIMDTFTQSQSHFVIQEELLGTGHALQQALPALQAAQCAYVLVINGDTPLVSTDILEHFLQIAQEPTKHEQETADIAFATITLQDAGAYGRVVRHTNGKNTGQVAAIVEAKDYDAAIHGAITGEVNAGVYFFRVKALEQLLSKLNCKNNSGEYYITDLVSLAVEANYTVKGIACGNTTELMGINSPTELVRSEAFLRAHMVEKALQQGVIIHMPESVSIGLHTVIEPGAEIFGPCEIYGTSHIARGAVVQSHCVLIDSYIATGAVIRNFSHLQEAQVGENATVGPYGRLRPGAVLQENAHVGNFVEMKKAVLGKGAKANHLTYLGDATIGSGTNIGAGTITCNYDGKNKFTTTIGERAFIGSNTALVAPVEVGDDALIGAGSVITKNIPATHMGIGRAKQIILKRK